MNVSTMRMPRAQAVRMLREYRRQIQRKTSAELEAVAEGLRHMARGRAVLALSEVIRAGGQHPNRLPKLAICRADMNAVDFRWHSWNRTASYTAVRKVSGGRPRRMSVEVDMGGLPGIPDGTVRGRAMTPLVPPAALRDAHTSVGALGRYFVLWEVETWEPLPPKDPYLLSHLGGDLYVVLAEWELTDLERAVIAGTRR